MKVNMGSMHPRSHAPDYKTKSSNTNKTIPVTSLLTNLTEILEDPEIVNIDISNVLQDYLEDADVDLDQLSTEVVAYVIREIKSKVYPKLTDAIFAEVDQRLKQISSNNLAKEKVARGEWTDPEEIDRLINKKSKISRSSSYPKDK